MKGQPLASIGEEKVEALLAHVQEEYDDEAIVVVVLSGSPERGLALSGFAAPQVETDPYSMLLYALTAEGLPQPGTQP